MCAALPHLAVDRELLSLLLLVHSRRTFSNRRNVLALGQLVIYVRHGQGANIGKAVGTDVSRTPSFSRVMAKLLKACCIEEPHRRDMFAALYAPRWQDVVRREQDAQVLVCSTL